MSPSDLTSSPDYITQDTLKDADQYPMLAEAFKSKKGETAVLRYARSEGAYARNLFREVVCRAFRTFSHHSSCTPTASRLHIRSSRAMQSDGLHASACKEVGQWR